MSTSSWFEDDDADDDVLLQVAAKARKEREEREARARAQQAAQQAYRLDDAFFEPLKIDNVRLVVGSVVKAKGFLKFQPKVLLFHSPSSKEEHWIEYMTIHSVAIEKRKAHAALKVFCKNFRKIEFVITDEEDAVEAHSRLEQFGLPESMEQLDAFQPQQELQAAIDGWKLYDAEAEYRRMGVPNECWHPTFLNQSFDLCPTYGNLLFMPAGVPDDILIGSAKFRSKGRLPALSYVLKNKAAICRCAQPLAGVNRKRSSEDEQLLDAIRRCNPSDKELVIIDLRPKVNAVANMAAGKGFETIEGYAHCRLEFRGIQNIHAMRDSLNGMLKVVLDSKLSPSKYLSGLKDCQWLKHIRTVLITSRVIVDYLVDGQSTVVHCSDGWDRTAQTCSIAGLMLDPYYRTIKGYLVLIEKEWLSFGHKFLDRNGFIRGTAKEVSPIFLQFLECTWHIHRQHPHSFEFNENFLVALHDCLHSCKFGTFLGNCDREREQSGLRQRTRSAWTYLFSRLEEWKNPFYDPSLDEESGILRPKLRPQHFEVWTAMYCRWDQDTRPSVPLDACYEHKKMELEHNKKRLAIAKQRLEALKAGKDVSDLTVPPPLPTLAEKEAEMRQVISQAW